MSADDVILVIRKSSKYYVVHANATDHWESDNWNCLINPETKYTFSRAKALIIGHDIQKKINSEYGVREVFD